MGQLFLGHVWGNSLLGQVGDTVGQVPASQASLERVWASSIKVPLSAGGPSGRVVQGPGGPGGWWSILASSDFLPFLGKFFPEGASLGGCGHENAAWKFGLRQLANCSVDWITG